MTILKAISLTLVMALMMPTGISVASASSKEAKEEATDEEGAPKAKPVYVPLEPAFVANFVDERIRYLRTDVTIRALDGDTQDAIRKHEYAVRHSLVMLFSRQTEDGLNTQEGRQQLQQEATAAIIDVLTSENMPSEVESVLFTTFVVQ